MLKTLQKCECADYGDNLKNAPERIIPVSSMEDNEELKKVIYYVPPNLGNQYIVRDKSVKLPEPSAYFRSPNTFMKSLLYLSDSNYCDNVHLSKKADMILQKYLRNAFQNFKPSKKTHAYKKITQIILNNVNGEFDTDPDKNPHFSKFFKVLVDQGKYDIVVVRADDNGNYMDTVPSRIPKKIVRPLYVLLQHRNGLFSPYGKK